VISMAGRLKGPRIRVVEIMVKKSTRVEQFNIGAHSVLCRSLRLQERKSMHN
jgi:hypothetical protein